MSAPVLVLRLYCDIVLLLVFTTYTDAPSEDMAALCEPGPVGIVGGLRGARAPSGNVGDVGNLTLAPTPLPETTVPDFVPASNPAVAPPEARLYCEMLALP